jgi:DNA-binding LacI/PurR family transcriptional regulator
MTPNSTTPTLVDIAQAAGVSTATVSRVLNDKGYVSDEVRRRVQQVIDVYGYQPQRVHKKAGDELWVAALADNLINPFFAQILAAAQEEALGRGLSVLVMQMPGNGERRAALLRQLSQRSWGGVIACGFYMSPEEWIELQEELQAPLVVFNTQVEHPRIAALGVNFERAAIAAVHHLLDLGHTRIAYLGDAAYDFSKAELRGVEIALQQRGLTYPDEYRISAPHTAEGATQAVHRMIQLPAEQLPTAVMTFDDEFAIHVLNALSHYGLSVPKDVSVVGFDNIPMAAHTSPPLTTIDVPKYRIGKQLIVLLQQLIENEGGAPVGQVTVEGSLLVRGSTGPARDRITA